MRKLFTVSIFVLGLFISSQLKENNNELAVESTPFTSYHLKLGCNIIQHESGSTIIIPEGTFDCNEKIIVKYREFRDPYDMIINDIPMHYINDNKRYQLESGGMFEIKAECNGVPIKPNKGKKIQIRYRCDKHIDNLEIYRMNEGGRYWQKKPIEIIEMSFDSKKNSSNRKDLWGNTSVNDNNRLQEDSDSINDFESGGIFSRKHPYFEGIFKGINISEMGLYNYDAIIKESGVIPIVANAVIIDQADLNIERLYVVYDSLNTSYYYTKADLKERFVIRPDLKAHIFGVLKNGFIATFSLARFSGVNWKNLSNKKFTFMLDLDPIKPTKKKDLKK